jgi:hypothetical protein
VIRGTQVKPLPLLPSGPGGVCSRPLHEARSLTNNYLIKSPILTHEGRVRLSWVPSNARWLLVPALCLPVAGAQQTGNIRLGSLKATLTSGSLAGASFWASFRYDAAQVSPTGESFVSLISFDFTLLGVTFTKSNILQGGQAIFRDGSLENVTASFQGSSLPPDPPVRNITFGFGGAGIIGYIDLDQQFGEGSFSAVPECPPRMAGPGRGGRMAARRNGDRGGCKVHRF